MWAAFYDLRSSSSSEASQQRLKERFLRIQSQAEGFAVPNEYGAMLQNAGAIGLNASTSHDNTRFFVSLPTNTLELWFALESERFQVLCAPVAPTCALLCMQLLNAWRSLAPAVHRRCHLCMSRLRF